MTWFVIIFMICLYFIPAYIGFYRNHHNENAIFWLNLLAGWTFIGWVGALIWALTVVQPKLNTPT